MAQKKDNDPKRMVSIKLFKDNYRYKDPLYVSVNDYSALIRRGEVVSVPYYVAKHIEEIVEQDESTAMLISTLSERYLKNRDVLS